jgi:hypothetical protein
LRHTSLARMHRTNGSALALVVSPTCRSAMPKKCAIATGLLLLTPRSS